MKYLLILFFVFCGPGAVAQPHIRGTVNLTMKEGLIACDFTLSNLPPLRHYRILLHHGMNIEFFVSDSGTVMPYGGFYSGKMTGEALEYSLMKNNGDSLAPLPQTLRIKYRGAFPVYGDTLSSIDFKGVVAFNGKTVRAAEQTKWYPVLYDMASDRLIENYTYDITVRSADAKTVFINGSMPQQKPVAMFMSKTPRALFLFAGDYDYVTSNGNYILNAAIDGETAKKIFTELDRIKAFQAKMLGMTYNENIYLISHKAVEPFNAQRSWGFTIFPSFAYAGLNFKTLLDSTGRLANENLAFFAHELAHYYFGNTMMSGPQQWFWLESTAEYLSLKTAEALADTAFYNKTIRNYISFLKSQKYKPLAQISSKEEIDDNYRYLYGPLLLAGFEKTFGQKRTYNILTDLIKKSGIETITLAVLKQTAIAHKIKEADYNKFYETYLSSPAALENTLRLFTTSGR